MAMSAEDVRQIVQQALITSRAETESNLAAMLTNAKREMDTTLNAHIASANALAAKLTSDNEAMLTGVHEAHQRCAHNVNERELISSHDV